MRLHHAVIPVLLSATLSACITMKSDHDELASEVMALRKKVAERDTELQETLTKAQEQMAEVEEQLAKAEKLLRTNQASLGVRVDNLEYDLAEVRGTAEDSINELAALSQNISESRAELDERLSGVETKLSADSDIPEGKSDLLRAAEKALDAKDYAKARRLFRTYLSRYPGDAKEPEVRFKIGQTLYSERDYRSSLGEFYWLVQNAPESEVIHDAIYYSGLAFANIGQCDKSLAYFNALVAEGSEAPDQYQKQAAKQIKAIEADTGKICPDRAPKSEDEADAEAADASKS